MKYLVFATLFCSASLTQAMETQLPKSPKIAALAAFWNKKVELPPKAHILSSITENDDEAELAETLPVRSQSMPLKNNIQRSHVRRSFSAPIIVRSPYAHLLPTINEMDETATDTTADQGVLTKLFKEEESLV